MRKQQFPKHLFKKYCRRCDKLYRPTGRYQQICSECNLQTEGLKQYKKRDEIQTTN